jgi:hypothetical protein
VGEWNVAPFRRVMVVLSARPLSESFPERVTGDLRRGLAKDMMRTLWRCGYVDEMLPQESP